MLIAKNEYGGVKKMAFAWAGTVRGKAINERSLQAGILRKIWLGTDSKFALVTNVLKKDVQNNDGEMKLNPGLADTGISTVEQLRDLIKSNRMYTNPVVYNLLCSGLESGKVRSLSKQGPTSIKKLLTVAHEGNLRMELYLALGKQAFGHTPSHDHSSDRAALWTSFCHLVHADRKANEEAATRDRHGAPDGASQDDEDDDDDDDDDAVPACDPKFYRDD